MRSLRGLIGGLLLLLISFGVYAEDPDKQKIERCTYLAGIAREVQVIRQTGVGYEQFASDTSSIYKVDEGYFIVLAVAGKVYDLVGFDVDSDDVFESLFDYCISPHIPEADIDYLI